MQARRSESSNDICIEVIEVTGSTVRIGIAAPRSIPVYREEIWAAVQAENAAAAKAPAELPDVPAHGEQQLPQQELT